MVARGSQTNLAGKQESPMTTEKLTLYFANNTGFKDEQIHITFQNGALGTKGFSVTYGGGTPVPIDDDDLMSSSLSLEKIGAAGFEIANAVSILVYVSYGKPLKSRKSAPAFIGGGLDFDTQFQTFEITMTGNPSDQGDMTAINYFTAPMQIESRDSDGTGLQLVGYRQNADEMAVKLGAAAAPPWDNLVTSADGYRIRLLGPSSYASPTAIPYPSFVPYLRAVHDAGQTTAIVNSNAFVHKFPTGEQTNYMFTLQHVATVLADASILLSGKITTTIIGTDSKPGPTFEDCRVLISAADENALNTTIYGQVTTSATTFPGNGWADFARQIGIWDLTDQNVEMTTKNLLIGEITTGLLLGLVNSDTIPKGHDAPLKDMQSQDWWQLSPLPAFAEAQPTHAYYNTYAAELFAASNNEVYSIPYSDRLGSGPLINSVSYKGRNVASWTVTLEPPLATPA
jgi:hypothetical protein